MMVANSGARIDQIPGKQLPVNPALTQATRVAVASASVRQS